MAGKWRAITLNDAATDVIGRVPGLRRLFGSTRETEVKTELVILLRPIVVDDDDDWPEIIRPAADRIQTLGSLQNRRGQESQ